MNIYVASSWRNPYQPKVVELLKQLGHGVYDFRNPAPDNKGFAWSEIDENWEQWTDYNINYQILKDIKYTYPYIFHKTQVHNYKDRKGCL